MAGAFPGTVKDSADIPTPLLEHLRYPEDLFKVQRYQFATYHVTDEGDFYKGNNRWAVPEDPYLPSQYQPPYRLFVNDGTEQQFSLTSTYVPSGKSNLAAFVSVNADATDPDGYGNMKVLQLPTSRHRSGPGRQRHGHRPGRRDALLEFSAGGSDVKTEYGNLLTLPVGEGLIYVQPVYASRGSAEASYPELQFVIVSYGDEVGIGRTLEGALAQLLDVDPGATPLPRPVAHRSPAATTAARTRTRSTSRSARSWPLPRPPSTAPTRPRLPATRSPGRRRSSGPSAWSPRPSTSPPSATPAPPPRPLPMGEAEAPAGEPPRFGCP